MPLALDQADVDRIARMLRSFEAGELYQQPNTYLVPRGVPIESYVGLVAEPFAASDGEPTQGLVSLMSDDGVDMGTESKNVIEALSLWSEAIPICAWVYLIRNPYSGSYFVWPTGSYGCEASGSGAVGAYYCLDVPDEGAFYCLDLGD
jgi:hypothetical protein